MRAKAAAQEAPVVKGWCPGAWRPMMSGDGLIVRVRPRLGRLSAAQVLALCDVAARFGSGVLDLTSRANVQIRGVAEGDHDAVLRTLAASALLDPDAQTEARRNVIVTPCWQKGDLSHVLADAVTSALNQLPELPGKMGICVDAGPTRALADASADFRFESAGDGGLVLRADGAAAGRRIAPEKAVSALVEMAEWFVASGGRAAGRMARHLKNHDLPEAWQGAAPAPAGAALVPGPAPGGGVYGAAFGQVQAEDLAALMRGSGASHMRVTHRRMVLLEGGTFVAAKGLVIRPDPLLDVHACPGAPFCAQASVSTRDLGKALAGHVKSTLHVSGCAKGCARRGAAGVTLVGRNGAFDLVTDGHAWDAPAETGLSARDLCKKFGIADAL